jgi:hypothetical protein
VKRKRIRSSDRGERARAARFVAFSHLPAPFESSRELKLDR